MRMPVSYWAIAFVKCLIATNDDPDALAIIDSDPGVVQALRCAPIELVELDEVGVNAQCALDGLLGRGSPGFLASDGLESEVEFHTAESSRLYEDASIIFRPGSAASTTLGSTGERKPQRK